MRERPAIAGAVVAFALPLALYLAFATRTLQGGDSAELALLAIRGGVAHPPGYPLYTLLARAAGALPFGAAAWRAAIPSAFAGAAAVCVIYLIGLRLTSGRIAPSFAGALAFAVAPLAWKVAGVPEVFSLLALSAAAAVLAALRAHDPETASANDPAHATRDAHVLGWVAGLGMANHHTLVLCAPVFAWGLAGAARRAHRPGSRALVRPLAAFAAGGALGLLPYLLLPLFAATAGEGAFVWGNPRSARGLLDHLLRRQYGTFRLSVVEAERSPLRHALAFVRAVPVQLFWVYLAAAIAGAVAAFRARRGFTLALLASIVLAGVVFPALFNLPDSAVAAAVAERFLLLPLVLLAVFLAPGLELATRRFSPAASRAIPFLPLPFAALLALPQARWSADPTVERYLVAAVREVEPRAVIVGEGDVTGLGTRWVTGVLGERADVEYLDLNLVRHRWYYDDARARIPELSVAFDAEHTHLGELVENLAVARPVYVTAWVASRLGERHAPQPAGFLARVPRPAPLPLADLEPSLIRATRALGVLPAVPIDPWSASFRDAAAFSWEALAKQYDLAGDVAGAARCRTESARLAAAAAPSGR